MLAKCIICIPCVGKFLIMFYEVMKTTLVFLLFCISLISGFAMAFFMLFQNQWLFNTPIKSWMKTLIMSTGEMDFSGVFKEDAGCGGMTHSL